MNLLTKEVENKFENFPYGSQCRKGLEAEVLVKYFNPCGAGTWIITEAEKEQNDWVLYGYCSLGYGFEYGPVLLSELQNLHLPYGLSIERDIHVDSHEIVSNLITVADLM